MRRRRKVFVLAGLIGIAIAGPALALEDEVTCLLRPRHIVHLGSPVNGIIAGVDVDRGDRVREGQVLARLESSVEEATVALDKARAADTSEIEQWKTQSAMLGRKVERIGKLAGKLVASAVSLDETQSEYEAAKIKETAAVTHLTIVGFEGKRSLAALELRRIKSPIEGVVIERKLEPGDYVSEQAPILTIAQIDVLNVEVIVPGRLYGSIKVGAHADVRPAPPLDGTYDAQVEVVDPVIDAASNTFAVRLKLNNPNTLIPAGLRCDVKWNK